MALKPEPGEKQLELVVRVNQDSETELQALFDSVLKPDSKRPLQLPLRMRNLPSSFFNPPSTGSKSPSVSHSRENSADSAFGAAPLTCAPSGLPVSHPRAHSSPASLQQTYAAQQQAQQVAAQPSSSGAQPGPQVQAQHHRTRSYDISDIPLPPGWEAATTLTGQTYYLNHTNQTTTWDDPRKTLAAEAQREQQRSAEILVAPHSPAQPHPATSPQPKPVVTSKPASPAPAQTDLGPLPKGWEEAVTPQGEIYFINHETRSTSWFDPRIPAHLQQSLSVGTAARVPVWLGPTQSQSLQSQTDQRLQSLHLEREKLKQRQQEIMRQQELMRQSTSDIATSGMDPFLSGLADHSRQESADSGLGLGNSYSLPHTPDFFNTMEDNMDGVSEGVSPSLESPDIGTDPTDDLVPSLTLGDDFLEDVQALINISPINPTSKADNVLTWL